MYHGTRYYAPWLGRWTSSDPEGLAGRTSRRLAFPHEWKLYVYTRDNSVVYVDPTGRVPAGRIVLLSLSGLAGVLVLLEGTGVIPAQDGMWVQSGECRLFDLWAVFHYWIPYVICLGITSLL